jgi:hypothetical protein
MISTIAIWLVKRVSNIVHDGILNRTHYIFVFEHERHCHKDEIQQEHGET